MNDILVQPIDALIVFLLLQVLNLLTSTKESAIGQFFNVGVLTLSVMLTKQTNLARKYLVEPLMEPLSSCSGVWVLTFTISF